MKKFVTTSAMFLLMGLAVPSFAARQDQKEEPHPAPARQEHQQPARQQHPPQATRPERPAAQPPQHQQAPQSRPTREAHPSHERQAPPQAQPQHRTPAQPEHTQRYVPQQHPPAHPPQAITHTAPPQTPPQRTYNGSHYGNSHNNSSQQHNYHGAPNAQQVREWQHSHAHSWNSQHRTWVQRGGYHGYRIPVDRFRVYFGRPHPFRIWGLPLRFVSGYPSFQYDNYWVTLVDPWPEFWPDNWYQADDVYLDYTDDGYYLYDLTRGGPGIACEVSD